MLPAEASGFLVGPSVFKTVVGTQVPRRVRFPSASARSDVRFWLLSLDRVEATSPGPKTAESQDSMDSLLGRRPSDSTSGIDSRLTPSVAGSTSLQTSCKHPLRGALLKALRCVYLW